MYNIDINFLYKFDTRESLMKHGKIRISSIPDDTKTFISLIKELVSTLITKSNKTWQVDEEEIDITIIGIINRDQYDLGLLENPNKEQYMYSVFIDIIDVPKYYYYGEEINI